jgi:hypothetical protein
MLSDDLMSLPDVGKVTVAQLNAVGIEFRPRPHRRKRA